MFECSVYKARVLEYKIVYFIVQETDSDYIYNFNVETRQNPLSWFWYYTSSYIN